MQRTQIEVKKLINFPHTNDSNEILLLTRGVCISTKKALSHPLKHNETLCTPEKLSHSQLASAQFALNVPHHFSQWYNIPTPNNTERIKLPSSGFMYLEVIARMD